VSQPNHDRSRSISTTTSSADDVVDFEAFAGKVKAGADVSNMSEPSQKVQYVGNAELDDHKISGLAPDHLEPAKIFRIGRLGRWVAAPQSLSKFRTITL